MSMSRKKVLWVDDEIEYLRSHIIFLESRGYDVTTAYSGDDAIYIIRQKPHDFDIVLLDEQMPGKGGLDTLGEIKEIVPDIPVVMVTKSEEEELMDEALGREIDGFLTKPVNPSQILLVCKHLLHSKDILSSKLKQEFVRNYSENNKTLQDDIDFKAWPSLYKNLIKWNIKLKDIKDEGIRQAYIGQRSDADNLFSEYIISNYMRWMQSKEGIPLFSPAVIKEYILPRLNTNEKVYLVIIDSMRLDQYMVIQPFLKKYFHIDNYTYYSILPSAPEYARASLLTGLYPNEIVEKYPEIYLKPMHDISCRNNYESILLKKSLSDSGILPENDIEYIRLTDEIRSQNVLEDIDKYSDKKLVTFVVDFLDMFIRDHSRTRILQDIAPDEVAFRKLIVSWFEHSGIYQILKKLSSLNCTVILTTSSGTNFCTRGTDVYGNHVSIDTVRYSYGENVTCDERYALFMHDPEKFNLYKLNDETTYVILKANFYFVDPNSKQDSNDIFHDTFQRGGISMEEMIVPLAVMTSKSLNI